MSSGGGLDREIMPHVAAMVGHGGFGTTLLGVAAGVPMAVVPLFAGDQRMHAARVAAAGAGIAVAGGPSAVPGLAEPVMRLLEEPSYRAAALSIAEEIAALPEVADAVPLIEGWARA